MYAWVACVTLYKYLSFEIYFVLTKPLRTVFFFQRFQRRYIEFFNLIILRNVYSLRSEEPGAFRDTKDHKTR